MEDFFNSVLLDPLKKFLEIAAAFVPNLLTALLLLILGTIIAWFIKLLITRLLKVLQLDVLAEKSGMNTALRNMRITETLSNLIGRISYWLVVLVFLTMALHALKTPAVEEFLARFFLYLPNVFVAVIVIVIGYLVGNFLGRATLIASVNADLPIANFLARFVKITIFIIAASMALELLGIGKDTVLVAFAIVFGGIVLALAIAFGLGAQEVAKEYLEKRLKEKERKKDDIEHI
jgi:small-conductance mechanosensitive channel